MVNLLENETKIEKVSIKNLPNTYHNADFTSAWDSESRYR